MAEENFILSFDASFLDRMDKADKALGDLIFSTDKLNDVFSKLAGGGLSKFAGVMNSVVSDIYKTSVCPLAKVMRRELKKRRINVQLRKEQGHDIDAACGQLRGKVS